MKHTHTITNALQNTPREYWRNDEFAWISIPKNANMQFRSICKSLQATRQKNDGTYPEIVVCVWRNPRTRLISGLGEYFHRKRRGGRRVITAEDYEKLLRELLQNPSKFDEHLEPQIVYAEGIKFSHVLKFEKLDQEMNRVPVFKQNPDSWHTRINADRLITSKHTKNLSLTTIQDKNQELIDNIIDKYYSIDQKIFQDPGQLENKT